MRFYKHFHETGFGSDGLFFSFLVLLVICKIEKKERKHYAPAPAKPSRSQAIKSKPMLLHAPPSLP